jgi:hypothetical protein
MLEPTECPDCDKGQWERLDCKSGSASECCMSCYTKVECETCNGTGEINED